MSNLILGKFTFDHPYYSTLPIYKFVECENAGPAGGLS